MSASANLLSPRLASVLAALPLRPGMRVLEIGAGTGALARVIADRIAPGGLVVALDRSPRAVDQMEALCAGAIAAGSIQVRRASAEAFALEGDEAAFDLVVANRVGALDGRHPAAGEAARERIRSALTPSGLLVIDGGPPITRDEL